VNLLEKQLSTVYFKDVRFPWVTLYMPCKPHPNFDFQLPVKNSSLVQQTDLKIYQNMVSIVHGDRCVECLHLLLRYCNLFVLGIWRVGTQNLCDVFKLINHSDDTCCS